VNGQNPADAPERAIQAVVVSKSAIVTTDTGIGPNTSTWAIGADALEVTLSQGKAMATGTHAVVKERLISSMAAIAWQILPNEVTALTGADAIYVVDSNGYTSFKSSVGKSGTYPITFALKNAPSVSVTVNLTVGEGNRPVIQIGGILEFDETDTARNIERGELFLNGSPHHERAFDYLVPSGAGFEEISEDGDITALTVLSYQNSAGTAIPHIDQSLTGVYRAIFNVTDSDGFNADTKARAVVVNDGRYTIDGNETPDDPRDDIIIGAKDYFITTGAVTGSNEEILERAYAEAYGSDGAPKAVEVVASEKGDYKAGAPAGDYTLTLQASGTSVRKQIIAHVVDRTNTGPEVPGGQPNPEQNDSKYGIAANGFRINTRDANNIATFGDLEAVTLDRSEPIVKLLISNPRIQEAFEPYAVISDNAAMRASLGHYVNDRHFTVRLAVTGSHQDANAYTDIDVWVMDSTAPILSVPKLKEITQGALFGDTDYRSGVVAFDLLFDGDITSRVTYAAIGSALNTNRSGLYVVGYDVTDLDGDTTTASGLVLVNDGRYIVDPGNPGDPDDGYVLGGKNFIIRADDVQGTDSEIIRYAYAEAYDIHGNPLPPVILDKGSYAGGADAGDYLITLSVPGTSLTRTITATVTEKDQVGPGTPTTDPGTDPNRDVKYGISANHFSIDVVDINRINNTSALAALLLNDSKAAVHILVPGTANSSAIIAGCGTMNSQIGRCEKGRA
jgi:hypothetical protein